MTVEEIFSKLSAHIIKGMMAHDQLASYYHFLGFDGCKCCHEYHFLAETLSYRKIQKYYIGKYNKLIPEEKVDDPEIMPKGWYKHTRQDVDTATKRTSVKNALNTWLNWEIETHNLYKSFYKELESLEEYDSADMVRCLMHSVEEEIRDVEKKKLKLGDVDYSLNYLNQCQSHLHDKYKKKKKELLE